MFKQFFKIDREHGNFRRLDLTYMGNLDKSIFKIETFKTDFDKRYLCITFSEEPSDEVKAKVERKVRKMAIVEPLKEDLSDTLLECKENKTNPDLGYLYFFDRSTERKPE